MPTEGPPATTEATTEPQAVLIFYSYAHKDAKLRDRLQNHLKILQRNGVLSTWYDRQISPGTDWNAEIHKQLDQAGVILLLVSASFLDSDYIYGVEMKRAFERAEKNEVRVVPIILRPCLWKEDPRLKGLQALPPNGKPVDSWGSLDRAFTEVAAGIKQVATELAPRALFGVSATIELPKDARAQIDALPPIWNVPHRRDPAFVGRDADFDRLEKALAAKRRGGAVVAVTGPPGIGKTSLVVEYAYRHSKEYEAVWWVRAREPATLASDLPALARPLRLPEADSPDPFEIANALKRWMSDSKTYLLIFDDVANPQAVVDRLPDEIGGHVILTTGVEDIPARARNVPIKPVSLNTSVDFLREKLGPEQETDVKNVAKLLGGLPLALGLTASYLIQNRETIRKFIGDLDLAKGIGADPGAAGAMELVLSRVEDSEPAAVDLLRIVSFLAAEDIPLTELSAAAAEGGNPLAEPFRDAAKLDALVDKLARYGVAWRAGDAISLHRHVQGLVRARLSDEDSRRWCAAALTLVEVAFPKESREARTWQTCSRLLPHALAAADHAESRGAAPLETGNLLRCVAVYLIGRAQLSEAVMLGHRALALHEKLLGPTDATVAADLVVLGRAYQANDDLADAKACFERAVTINEELYGSADPKVAHDLIYFGRFLRRIRDLDAAKTVLTRAIQLTEQAKGPADRDVGWAKGHLGRVLQDLGERAEAETALTEALAIDEAALGRDHSDVATDLVNLSRVQRELKKLDAAEANLERALAITTREYGPDHYEVAIVEANIGRVKQDRGDLVGAVAHLTTAVNILAAGLGDGHSYTVSAREWLENARQARDGASTHGEV